MWAAAGTGEGDSDTVEIFLTKLNEGPSKLGVNGRRGWNLTNTEKDSIPISFSKVICVERSKLRVER
jgi:hypothetical protein